MSCPKLVCAASGGTYVEKTGLDYGIFVHTGHTISVETTDKGGADMTEEARVFAFRRRRETEQDQERQAFLEGLAKTRTLIAQAYAGFNSAKDPDLIESYVFEINALQSRYSYLLRRVKELEGQEA